MDFPSLEIFKGWLNKAMGNGFCMALGEHGTGPGTLQRSLPTPTSLKLCDSVTWHRDVCAVTLSFGTSRIEKAGGAGTPSVHPKVVAR